MTREVSPHPRPAARVVNPDAGVDKIRREGRCRACGLKGTASRDGGVLNRGHLVSRSQRGDDVDENIVPLCGSGTTGCHGALTDGNLCSAPSLLAGCKAVTVASMLLLNLTDEERRYCAEKKDPGWLRRRYLGDHR